MVVDRGHGPAIVLAHGMLLDHTMFAPQVEALCGAHRVIAYDLRSRDQRGDAPFDAAALADDCAALLDELGIERAVIAGMSLGGTMALQFALRHRERTAGLVLVAAAGPGAPEDDAEAEAVFATQRERPTVDPDFARAEAEAHFSPRSRREHPELVAAWAAAFAGRSGRATWHETLCWSRQPDTTDELAALDVPALVVWGDEDACVPLARGLRLAALLPGARLLVVPFAGHAVNVEAPAAVNAAIATFMEEHVR